MSKHIKIGDEEFFQDYLNIESDSLHIKYPRTYHLPYSPGSTNDDKFLESDEQFIGKEVVVTLKMDGENCNMTHDKIWARSVDSRDHVSRNWVQNMWNVMKYDIPEDMRICGESLYAKHAIYYTELPSFFMCFNIWQNGESLSWDDTVEMCELFGIEHVPVLYRGIYDKKIIQEVATSKETIFGGEREGVVVRLPGTIKFSDWKASSGKYVRAGHVQPNVGHWFSKPVVPNIMIYK